MIDLQNQRLETDRWPIELRRLYDQRHDSHIKKKRIYELYQHQFEYVRGTILHEMYVRNSIDRNNRRKWKCKIDKKQYVFFPIWPNLIRMRPQEMTVCVNSIKSCILLTVKEQSKSWVLLPFFVCHHLYVHGYLHRDVLLQWNKFYRWSI